MRATLRDIARRANVHYSTVSHVINGAGGNTRVSDETRQRVLEAAASLGYTVNRAAQQLKTRRSRVVGLLVGALENPFFARMVSLCSEALEREGYNVVLAMRRNDENSDLHLLQTLISRQLDGLLLWNETVTEMHERVQQPDLTRVVVMGFAIPGRDSVAGILDTGVQAALEHLAGQNRQRIGYLAPIDSLTREGEPRHELYCRLITALGQPPRIYAYSGAAFDIGAARLRATAILEETTRPDALLCYNDMAAVGAMMGLRAGGARIPEDIALVGCDDLPIAAQLDIPLTSVTHPLAETCRVAVQMLLERIAAEEEARPALPIRSVKLFTTLSIRESSQCGATAPCASLL